MMMNKDKIRFDLDQYLIRNGGDFLTDYGRPNGKIISTVAIMFSVSMNSIMVTWIMFNAP